nr:hypothetical protein CFP56_53943 [Quercus suber]
MITRSKAGIYKPKALLATSTAPQAATKGSQPKSTKSVVHSCKSQRHIKHEWGASLTNVGLDEYKSKLGACLLVPALGAEDKTLRAWLPKEDNELARG